MEMDFMRLREAKHIWIYGAGVVGKRVWKLLSPEAFHLPIEGMVVSAKSGQKEMEECPLAEIGDVKTKDAETVFIIAVSVPFQQEVVDTLLSKGYGNYILWNRTFVTERWYLTNRRFEDRRKGLSKVCIVLSGYKEFLWKNVFDRLERFVPDDVEVCILSSGLYSEKLSEIAEKNDWSYLSTEMNDITLIQNMAVRLYEKAEWFYKMDEDIFLTRNCFERIMQTHIRVEEQEPYKVGFTAPLIPVNGYGHIRILDFLQKRQQYERKFERAFYGGNPESMLEKDIGAAQFFWGMGGEIPQLDSLNDMFAKRDEYGVCGVRFSIGFILFRRSIWERMKGFSVTGGLDLGVDEDELCRFCVSRSTAMIVAENTVVGHFSFRQQAGAMREFYEENQELFQIRQEGSQCGEKN